MKGYRPTSRLRSAMATLSIAIFLFSYVNATMFWHGHGSAGYRVFHSHIATAAHRAAASQIPHNAAELQLIEAANQASFTDDVMPVCELEPFRTVTGTVLTQPASVAGIRLYDLSLLRGPPALV